MKIEREDGPDLGEAVRDGLHALVHGRPAPRSEEERLLTQRDARRRRMRGHWNAYISVIGGLGIINLVTWILFGAAVPWVIFPAAAWGIGVGMHALNYRGWTQDHAARIAAAERALGRLPPGAAPLALAEGPPAEPDPWADMIARCRDAVDRAAGALESVDHPAQDLDATHADLEEGLERVERLAEGAGRIRRALETIAPAGLEGLAQQVAELDAAINAAKDDALRAVHLENRALLVARRAKVEALVAEQDRMMANARGFLLATENLHLDAAGLGNGALDGQGSLTAPIRRLGEEVDVLRKVEAELRRL